MLKFMDSIGKNMRSIIALSVVYLAFAFLFCLLFVKIPPENKDIVNIATGAIIVAGITGVMTYYFGSSKDKSDADKAVIQKDIVAAQNSTQTNSQSPSSQTNTQINS